MSEAPSDAPADPADPPDAGTSETTDEPADALASASLPPQEPPDLSDEPRSEHGSDNPEPARAQSGSEAELAASPPAPAVPPAPSGPNAIPGLPDLAGPEEDLLDDIPEFEDPDTLPDIPSDAGPVVRTGARCKGTVVAVRDSGVIVAFGTKVEGSVPLAEFLQADGTVSVEPGQEIEVLVERMGAPGEYAALSFKRIRELEVWAGIQEAHAHNLPLKGSVVGTVKGGLRVDIGVPAFMPGSQIDIRPVRKMDSWVGSEVEVAVIECDRRRGNVVVSRSGLLRARQRELRAETLGKLAVGEPATGQVTTITSFGVFVDLGGIEGMIKYADLSYGRVRKAEDHVQAGQELTAKVMRIDEAKDRIVLSLKAMQPDPWLTIGERFTVGQRVRGRVTSVKDYGAFVELEPGVEGLIHFTEIDWSRRAKHPTKTFTPNADAEAVVLAIDPDQRRISLSAKRLTPDPWDTHAASLEVGQVVKGVVRKIENYGLFVEIAPGIEGLVHVSDLSWDSRPTQPREVAQKGQEISTVILQADLENRKLSLGVKQLQPDAWDAFLIENSVGDVVPGTVRRIAKFGAFVELATGVEGLCHSSQLPKDRSAVKPGQQHQFEILELNGRTRRIGLRYL
ncbi:MAG: S1 RNA-binding domain-containing protein [Bryobacterales bacterium]|nr:S1 RNA-binding domain-containing protein [Bryobacterales bacterium]MDE0621206.1 S1 RNA-binding domain-containing protein [Bryobacterales bacterium]